MTRRNGFALFLSSLSLALVFCTGSAVAQKTDREKLVGTWTIVLVDNVRSDGSRIPLYGPNPQGIAMFDTEGHYSLQIMSDGRPKFAANDKSKGTPDEYKAAVQGSNCHFGTYSVNEFDHTVTLHVEHATFSNWEGTNLTWPLKVNGDESRFTIPHPTSGGADVTGEVGMKRTR
jgi:Lipocalin-like domain